MNALQVALFAAVAAVALAQFDGADFSAYGQQAAGGDAPQFDSSAFSADAGQAFGQQGAAGQQDFQGFQGFQGFHQGAGNVGGGQVAGGQHFDASAFAGAFGGDADAAHHFQ